MDIKSICEKIKRIRLSRNITLKALAEKTGLTNGYLSRIENSETAPPISTLNRIAEGLGVDVSYFFVAQTETERGNTHIVIDRQSAASEGDYFSALNGVYQYRPLFPDKQGKNVQPFIVVPGFDFGPAVSGKGENFNYLIEGSIEFLYGDEKYIFSQGDSFYFDTEIPFNARSLGKDRAKLLVVSYPYRRR